jgi:hypothetical protein
MANKPDRKYPKKPQTELPIHEGFWDDPNYVPPPKRPQTPRKTTWAEPTAMDEGKFEEQKKELKPVDLPKVVEVRTGGTSDDGLDRVSNKHHKKKYDSEYKHFRDCVQGYWGHMDWSGERGGKRVKTAVGGGGTTLTGLDNKKSDLFMALDGLMLRKGIYNAKRLTRRERQQQKLLDEAWDELHGRDAGDEGGELQEYRDSKGRLREHRPTKFVADEIPKKTVRTDEYYKQNAARLNADPKHPYFYAIQRPYVKKTRDKRTGKKVIVRDKDGEPILITPDKWMRKDKKTGKIVQWPGK